MVNPANGILQREKNQLDLELKDVRREKTSWKVGLCAAVAFTIIAAIFAPTTLLMAVFIVTGIALAGVSLKEIVHLETEELKLRLKILGRFFDENAPKSDLIKEVEDQRDLETEIESQNLSDGFFG